MEVSDLGEPLGKRASRDYSHLRCEPVGAWVARECSAFVSRPPALYVLIRSLLWVSGLAPCTVRLTGGFAPVVVLFGSLSPLDILDH